LKDAAASEACKEASDRSKVDRPLDDTPAELGSGKASCHLDVNTFPASTPVKCGRMLLGMEDSAMTVPVLIATS
jgi:hypothetical protein